MSTKFHPISVIAVLAFVASISAIDLSTVVQKLTANTDKIVNYSARAHVRYHI